MATIKRSEVIEEARLLLVEGGQLLVVDFYSGPVGYPFGLILRFLGFCAEMVAGGDHFRNYREFMTGNGLTALMTPHRLQIVHQVPVWWGTIADSLLDFAL